MYEMKWASLSVVLLVAILCFGESHAFATLAETITPKAISGQCASGGTMFENRTPNSISFDLFIQNSTGAACPITVSWSDAAGESQTVTVSTSLDFATSLEPNGAISWSSQGNGNVNFNWYVAQPVSVANNPSSLNCQSSGTLYENLTKRPIELRLALVAQAYPVSLRWVDATRTPQELDLSGATNGNGLPEYQDSEGVATSLPPGGAIFFVSGSGKYCTGGGWQLERAVNGQ
jgi:hypothetical protein